MKLISVAQNGYIIKNRVWVFKQKINMNGTSMDGTSSLIASVLYI